MSTGASTAVLAVSALATGRSSILQECVAGVASAFPSESTARTERLCTPGGSGFVENVAVQAVKALPSTLHSNVAVGSSEVNVKSPVGSSVGLGSAVVMLVFGAAVSIVQSYVAGVASVLPAASVARTE